jgi:hypothetical protein
LVLNLHRAALENQKQALKATVIGESIAITYALDLAFNKGKGEVMKQWLKAMDGEECEPKQKAPASPEVMGFFMSLPRKDKKDSR